MRKQTFEAEVRSGHKGCAVELPFDPHAVWGEPQLFVYGQRQHRVDATVNGVELQAVLIKRGAYFLPIDDETLTAAKAAVGDTVKVGVKPVPAAKPAKKT